MTLDFAAWVQMVEIPALVGLFGLLVWNACAAAARSQVNRDHCDAADAALREALNAFKVQVAERYATVEYLKDVEKRLSDQIHGIDKKLDRLLAVKRGQAS